MDLKKIYYDSCGDKCNILQMVILEPTWAANRLQEGEKAIEELAKIKAPEPVAVPEILPNTGMVKWCLVSAKFR